MLVRCSNVYGGFRVVEASPRITVTGNVMVQGNALYDQNRFLVPDSALVREHGALSYPDAGITTSYSQSHPKRVIGEPIYWVGQLHRHFGHFLISTLPRFWARGLSPRRFGYTGRHLSAEAMFEMPFANAFLSSLGLKPQDFVKLEDFDRLEDVVVPGSAFLENSVAYADFRLLNQEIARNTRRAFTPPATGRPIYLSKARMPAGVSRISNEEEITSVLDRAGVSIVFPEEISISAQIAMWNANDLFLGYAGSALHLAAFAERKKIISLNHSRFAESNQILIDQACRHDSVYLYPHDGVDILPAGNGFHREVRIRHPRAIAHGLLRAIDLIGRAPAATRMSPRPAEDTNCRLLYIDEPFGRNVARNKQARISSSDPNWQIRDAVEDANGAVSGTLSQTYQFHTLNEQSPWWEVDLGAAHVINEVRVFNRHDVARWRASPLQILFSADAVEWTLVGERSDRTEFDGFDNDPYRWKAEKPLQARFVRIQLPTHDMLHLNQVEVFGYPADALTGLAGSEDTGQDASEG